MCPQRVLVLIVRTWHLHVSVSCHSLLPCPASIALFLSLSEETNRVVSRWSHLLFILDHVHFCGTNLSIIIIIFYVGWISVQIIIDAHISCCQPYEHLVREHTRKTLLWSTRKGILSDKSPWPHVLRGGLIPFVPNIPITKKCSIWTC